MLALLRQAACIRVVLASQHCVLNFSHQDHFGNSIDTPERGTIHFFLLRYVTTPAAGFEPAVSHVGEGERLAAQGADAVRRGGRLLRVRALQDAAPAHAQDGVHHDAAPLPHAPGIRGDRERGGTHHVRVEGARVVFLTV